MTESELKQLYYLNRETERLQKDLRQLEMELECYDGYKGNQLSHAPKGKGFDMYDKLSEMLDDKRILIDTIRLNLTRIQRERAKIEKYIGGIEDAEIRLIFRLRHINGMTWEDIAAESMVLDDNGNILKSVNRTTVMRKYKKYLRNAHIAHKGYAIV